jgi:hypothetical protein
VIFVIYVIEHEKTAIKIDKNNKKVWGIKTAKTANDKNNHKNHSNHNES